MSKISSRSYACPQCHHEGEFVMYDSVNVELDPELRDKVLSGDIFAWKCPHCGESMHVLYDLLYHDMKNGFMIYFAPGDCDVIKQQVNDMLDKYPGMRHSIYRTTSDVNRLNEKILILESGLNDIAIELAKVLIKVNKDNDIPFDAELYFERYIPNEKEEDKGIITFQSILDGKPQKGMIVLHKEGYNSYLNAVLNDNKFSMDKYCETIDEAWILDKFK